MEIKKILVTCPPMLGMLDELKSTAKQNYYFDLVPKMLLKH